MDIIFSNGRNSDYVENPFRRMLDESNHAHLAAPYFTEADLLYKAASRGKSIQLLIGLNGATSPRALKKVHEVPGIAIRYFTRRFHAKIFIFENAALLGSANLTDGGLRANREAVIALDRETNMDALEDVKGLFVELWETARVLTSEKLAEFEQVHAGLPSRKRNEEKEVEDALGQAQPPNINVDSHVISKDRIFIEGLRREVYEQYRPAFDEVSAILEEHGFRRPELVDVGTSNETNRFLNYVRLTYVTDDDAWEFAPSRSAEERRQQIERCAQEWVEADDSKIPADYLESLRTAKRIFGTRESIEAADKAQIMQGLMSVHAFIAQRRFVKGGLDNLPEKFWKLNKDDLDRVKATLCYLLHEPGDFIQRFHDVLYDRSFKLKHFGYFCALELYGTIKPDECPPMNGRIAKALRFLGFEVKGN